MSLPLYRAELWHIRSAEAGLTENGGQDEFRTRDPRIDSAVLYP